MSRVNTSMRDIQVTGPITDAGERVLTDAALDFVGRLHRRFNTRREELVSARRERQARIDAGEMPTFREDTREIREGDWQVAPTPDDLQQRWVEITGPVDRKMMINAFNSGADVFMADFEDALSPTWENVVQGQANLIDAVRRQIGFYDESKDKEYALDEEIATLLVRPRGWHLREDHVLVDGEPISASLFDFGLYMFHNAQELLDRGSGPYFYLPKLECSEEARLWNDVFNEAQDELGVPHGSVRATVLIETVLAAFEMEEILYELREHMAGLNAGRWDYIFSVIKKFARHEDLVLPDRVQITMTVPFMRAYTELLVQACHRRGAHAIGGMAAFIPSRDLEVNKRAFAGVRDDKRRESRDGFDGTWVAHPGLVPVAREEFRAVLGHHPHQKHRMRDDVDMGPDDLLDIRVPGGTITEQGIRTNVNVALQYLNAWLLGNGAAAIFNLMEDTATAEISRAQLWQWLHHGAELADGRPFTQKLYEQIREEELATLGGREEGRYADAAEILDRLILSDDFIEFLTYIAYDYID